MSEPQVTEADRATAKAVTDGWFWGTADRLALNAAIAAALSAEREKARAPFLALAEELLGERYDSGSSSSWGYSDGLTEASDRIRRAAEDPS